MNIVRQIMAVSVVMYGYIFLNKGGIIKFLLCIFAASLFHMSAVVGLAALVIRRIDLSNTKVITGIMISAIIGFFGVATRGLIFSKILGPYGVYLNKIRVIRTSLLAPAFLSCVLSSFFLWMYGSSNILLKSSLWMKLFFIAVIANNAFIFIDYGLRLAMFFSIGEIILFPLYVQSKSNTIREKNVPFIVVLVYLGGILFTLLSIKSAIVAPYSNVLHHVIVDSILRS
jgi:hypothetical protein